MMGVNHRKLLIRYFCYKFYSFVQLDPDSQSMHADPQPWAELYSR